MPKIVIRQANVLDYVKILRLIVEAKDPPGIRAGALDPTKLQQFLLTITQPTANYGYTAVADLGGNIVGVMGCSAWLPPWSRAQVLNLEFFYVQPMHRKGGVPRALLVNVQREARRAGVELRLQLSARDVESIGEPTLKTSGFRDAGRVFLMGGKDAGLPDTGSTPKRDNVDVELSDDEPEFLPPRPDRDDVPEGDGPPEVVPPEEATRD
jgi:GNAT superfamily N-acetyltransferase